MPTAESIFFLERDRSKSPIWRKGLHAGQSGYVAPRQIYFHRDKPHTRGISTRPSESRKKDPLSKVADRLW